MGSQNETLCLSPLGPSRKTEATPNVPNRKMSLGGTAYKRVGRAEGVKGGR